MIFIPTIGSVAWLALGRPLSASWRPGDTRRRPPPRRTLGPEDLPDFPATRPDDDRDRRLRQWEEELRRRERDLRPDDDDNDNKDNQP